jgi:hypothetical protein
MFYPLAGPDPAIHVVDLMLQDVGARIKSGQGEIGVGIGLLRGDAAVEDEAGAGHKRGVVGG